MTRALLSILTVGLLACGGSAPRPATPGGGTGGAGGDEPARTSADDGTAAPDTPDKPGPAPDDTGAFAVHRSDPSSRPARAKLKATDTEAAVRFFVIDKDKGPIAGVVISLTSPTGEKYYTEETDAEGSRRCSSRSARRTIWST
jgi:hypothetical protein